MIDQQTYYIATNGCWLWTGKISKKGYGFLVVDNKILGAHKFIYEIWRGKVPEGKELDHYKIYEGCQKHCVNPNHLEPVSHTVNMLRSDKILKNIKRKYCECGTRFWYYDYLRNSFKKVCKNCNPKEYEQCRPNKSLTGTNQLVLRPKWSVSVSLPIKEVD